MNSGGGGGGGELDTPGKKALVVVGASYVFIVLLLPFMNIFYQAFNKGVGPFFTHLVDPEFLHAIKLTLMLAAIAVPINTAFGIAAALLLTRNEFPGKALLLTLLDLPFSISPVVTGLMLTLLYGRRGIFFPILDSLGVQIVFAFPAMLLATLFVTLPYVARELIPVLESQGTSEEEAARTLGASEWEVFWNVTLPNIRFGLMYGMILTNARAMGEFGAVAVVSGNIIGQTQTATLYVEAAYKEYNTEAAFSAAVVLSLLAMGTILVKDRLEHQAAKEIEK